MLGQQVMGTERHSGTAGRKMEAFRERTQQFSKTKQRLQNYQTGSLKLVDSTPNSTILSTTYLLKYVHSYNLCIHIYI